MIQYNSIREIVEAAEKAGLKISELCLKDQAQQLGITEEELYREMEKDFDVMIEAADWGQQPGRISRSGLTGEEGYRMKQYAEHKGGLTGSLMTKAMARALAVSNCNAAMGRIVATPTAGSCGILPGCLVPMYEDRNFSKRDVVMSIFTAGAFGMVIATNACIAGAQGGCQAECGSAAGMAAAALVELMGGTPAQCADALGMVIVNELGLVEIPCIKRNAAGVILAYACADMALADIGLKIPADECITAMKEVGDRMSSDLKETAGGGLATTPTGRRLKEQVFGKE